MKTLVATALTLFSFVSLVGCSSTPTAKYNEKISYASNLAASAKAFTIKDTEVPKEAIASFDKNGISDIAWVGAAGISPPPGVTKGFSLGITAAAIIFGPKDPANESRVLVWVPKDQVGSNETPREFAFKTINKAYQKTAESFGLQSFGKDNQKTLGFSSSKDISKIGENVLLFVLGDYKEVNAPESLGGRPSYLYTTDSYLDYSSKIVTKDFNSVNDFQFLVKLSSEMPDWVVMYIKPGFVKINGEENKFPFMLQGGKIHLFVIPK